MSFEPVRSQIEGWTYVQDVWVLSNFQVWEAFSRTAGFSNIMKVKQNKNITITLWLLHSQAFFSNQDKQSDMGV